MVQAGQLPLTRVWEIFRYFKSSPPVHLLIRDWVGYKNSEAETGQDFQMPPEIADAPRVKELPPHILKHLQSIRDSNA